MVTAEQIMSRHVVTIAPTETVRDAIYRVVARRVSGLPVVEAGRLVGVISEFALLAAAYDAGVQSEPVDRHMTRSVITVEPTDSLSTIAELLMLHRVRRLPVTRERRLVGLVSRRDVLGALKSWGGAPISCTPACP